VNSERLEEVTFKGRKRVQSLLKKVGGKEHNAITTKIDTPSKTGTFPGKGKIKPSRNKGQKIQTQRIGLKRSRFS